MNQKKRNFKGVLSGFMATALTASLLPLPEASATTFADVYDAWYVDSVTRWAATGVVSGKGDNLFAPDDTIKRGEIAVMVDNLMGYEASTMSEHLYSDLLNSSAWYYAPLRKLNGAGVMNGMTTNTMGPEESVTRQMAAVILVAAFDIEPSTATNSSFADNSNISDWAMNSVITLSDMGIITGRGDNMFYPTENVTRAEFAGMLNAMVSTYISADGTSTNPSNSEGTMLVNTATTISSRTINGDLILAPGIEDGDVYLDNVTVTGNIIVRGGGHESIYLNNVAVEGDLVVGRQADQVRIVVKGDTAVPTITIDDNCTIDTTELSTEGTVGDVTILSAETVVLLGGFDSLTNESTGVDITLDGYISEIQMNAGGTINETFVSAGSSFDSNSIPNVDLSTPEITLTHNYGNAEDDEDNEPFAESEVMSVELNEETSEVVALIRVEADMDDCALMSEAANAITLHNPNNLSSLSGLELAVERTDYSSYTEFEVTFTMTQSFSEVPLSVNFKDKYSAPEVNITMNFNDLPKATAEVELSDLDYKSSTGTASATIDLTDIKYCEPHYLEKYVITCDNEDLELELGTYDYDSEDASAYYNITFNGDVLDSVDLTINFLKTDAQDEIPSVEAIMYHTDEEKDLYELKPEYAELNVNGQMEVKLVLSNMEDYALLSSISKAITIRAESDQPESGYGLSYEVELLHDGSESYYIVTFTPSSTVEEVIFQVNVEGLNENIPTMLTKQNLTLRQDLFDAETALAIINLNTREYSRSQVSVEVAVDLELLEELKGYEIDSTNPFTVSTDNGELTDYSVSKIEDGLYLVKFTPFYADTNEGTTPQKTTLTLNLKQSTGYIGLYAVGDSSLNLNSATASNSVPVENLPYTTLASSYSGTDTYDYTTTFTVVTDEKTNFVGEFDPTNPSSYISIRPKVELATDDEDYVAYLESDYVTKWKVVQNSETVYSGSLYEYKLTVHIDTYPGVRPADLALNLLNVAGAVAEGEGEPTKDPFLTPTVSLLGDNADYFTNNFNLNNFNTESGFFSFTVTEKIPSDTQMYSFAVAITAPTGNTFDSSPTISFGEGQYTINGTLPDTLRNVTTAISLNPTHASELFTDITVSSDSENLTTVTIRTPTHKTVTSITSATYTVDVEIPEGYELENAPTGTNYSSNFKIDGEAVSSATYNSSTDDYTLTFDVTDYTTTAVELSVELLEIDNSVDVDKITLASASEGFTVSGDIISRPTAALTFDTITAAGDLTYVIDVTLKNETGETLYWSLTDPTTSNTWTKESVPDSENFVISDHYLKFADLDTDLTIYVSYSEDGTDSSPVTVEFDNMAVDSTQDIFELSADGVETYATSGTWSGLKEKANADFKFTYFTFENESFVTDNITFGGGYILVTDDDTQVITDEDIVINLGQYGQLLFNGYLYDNMKGDAIGFEVDGDLKYDKTPPVGKAVGDSVDAIYALSAAKIDWQINKSNYSNSKTSTLALAD